MKKYIAILLISLVLTTNAVAKSVDDDGIPKDRSWIDKQSPIITLVALKIAFCTSLFFGPPPAIMNNESFDLEYIISII